MSEEEPPWAAGHEGQHAPERHQGPEHPPGAVPVALYDPAPWLTIAPGVRARGGAPLVAGDTGPSRSPGSDHARPAGGVGAAPDRPFGGTKPAVASGAPLASAGGAHRGSGDPMGTAAEGYARAAPTRGRHARRAGAGRSRRWPRRGPIVLGVVALGLLALVVTLAQAPLGQGHLGPGAGGPSPASGAADVQDPTSPASSRADGVAPGGWPAAVPEVAGPGASTSGPPLADDDWWSILGTLDRRRAEVLASRDLARVATYAAPGSAFSVGEVALVRRLAADGLRPDGWGTSVVAIEEAGPGPTGSTDESPGRVVLTVVDQRSAYRLRDERGSVVESIPAAGRRRWRITLEQSGAALSEATQDALSAVADDVRASADGSPTHTPGPRGRPDPPGAQGQGSPPGAQGQGSPPGAQGQGSPPGEDALAWRIASVEAVP